MIYFDSAATALQRPPSVAEAVARAISEYGNPGRSFHDPSLHAARGVCAARRRLANLLGLEDSSRVAFTSGATEALNLVIGGLVSGRDAVITSVLEHNSVLRPLYASGCRLDFLDCDDQGNLRLDGLERLLKRDTRFFVCTHGSNLLGSLPDIGFLSTFCRDNGLTLILDAAQTLGRIMISPDAADALCFSGHKALFGPQGTGGVILRPGLRVKPTKTGGSGADSFSEAQPARMPDVLEAGTPNAHGLAGLEVGAAFVQELGMEAIRKKENALTDRFLGGLSEIPGIQVYGPPSGQSRLPIMALNVDGLGSDEAALRLWDGWNIATRPGFHCAPLLHRRFKTEHSGMVRFSFSYFNTAEEIDAALEALRRIARAV